MSEFRYEEYDAMLDRLRADLASVTAERDAARKERDEALRLRDERQTLQAAARDSALRQVDALRERVTDAEARVKDCGHSRDVAIWQKTLTDAQARVLALEGALEDVRGSRCIRDGNEHHVCNCNCDRTRAVVDAALKEKP